ncbi:MAG: HNH endonuclease [Actinomycetota bacterium]|nr:HNH endonuclease [Actinomycetota bacterium]
MLAFSTMNPDPPGDRYDALLATVVESLVAEGREAAGDKLQAVVVPYTASRKRPPIPPALAAQVFRRDRFTCRYCSARTIPTPIMRAISLMFPAEFRYHKNWKVGETHPAINSRSATVDHVEPHAHGGANQLENLVTACWGCNIRKGDRELRDLGWELLDVAQTDWVGLTNLYPRLWEVVEATADPGPSDRALHRTWMRVLGDGRPLGI